MVRLTRTEEEYFIQALQEKGVMRLSSTATPKARWMRVSSAPNVFLGGSCRTPVSRPPSNGKNTALTTILAEIGARGA